MRSSDVESLPLAPSMSTYPAPVGACAVLSNGLAPVVSVVALDIRATVVPLVFMGRAQS